MSVYDFVSQGTPDDIVERYVALKNDAETSDFGVLDRNVVILDTETTASQNHGTKPADSGRPPECGVVTEWFVTLSIRKHSPTKCPFD
ncbi:MAG: hypothetical protein ACLT98_07250 [Eggerthellaceae bacterium]